MIMRVLASCAVLTLVGGAFGSAFEAYQGSVYSYSYLATGSMTANVAAPAPGAMALLGLAGLAFRPRRR